MNDRWGLAAGCKRAKSRGWTPTTQLKETSANLFSWPETLALEQATSAFCSRTPQTCEAGYNSDASKMLVPYGAELHGAGLWQKYCWHVRQNLAPKKGFSNLLGTEHYSKQKNLLRAFLPSGLSVAFLHVAVRNHAAEILFGKLYTYCLMHFLRKVMFSDCAFGISWCNLQIWRMRVRCWLSPFWFMQRQAIASHAKDNQSSRCFFSGRPGATDLSFRHVLSSGNFLLGKLPSGAFCLRGKHFMTQRLRTKSIWKNEKQQI